MGIRIDGAADLINATDGSLTVEGQSINSTGIVTASGGFKVGTAATIYSNGNATFSGIITAASHLYADQGHFTDHIYIADTICHTGDTNTKIRFPSADKITLETAGVERFRVDSNGKVGVGTDNPGQRLEVFDDDVALGSDGNIMVRGIGDGADKGGQITFGNKLGRRSAIAGNQESTGTTGYLLFGTRASSGDITERMRITSTGAVGINSAIPTTSFLLDVNGDLTLGEKSGTDNTYLDQKQDGDLHIINSGRTSNGATGTSAGGIGVNRYNNIAGGTSLFRDFTVYDGKNKKILAVDGSVGCVGINTDSPGDALQIDHATDPAIRLHYGNNSGYSVINIDNGNNVRVHVDPTGAGSNSNFQVHIDGTERMELQNDGDLKLNDGDFIVGTAGHGVLFSGHAAANNLDDYETGTFSMSVNLVNESYTAQTFYYVKIGRLVTWSGRLHWTGGSGTSDQILGLPFTVRNLDYTNNMTTNIYVNSGLDVGSNDYLCAYHAQGNSRLNMTFQTPTSAYNLPGAANIYMTGFYYTDS